MKKLLNLYSPFVLVAIIGFAFTACDRDFTSIESDIEGIKNFENTSMSFPVVAYNKKLNPVQTNGLSSYLLGIYDDHIYGKTTASIVSQMGLSAYGVDYGDAPEVESVILTIPYFSTGDGTDEDGNNLYVIDSLFGNQPVKFSIYQNNYFLRDFDPETNLTESQNYYSNANQTINFNNHQGQLLFEDDMFVPDDSEIVIEEISEETGELEVVNRLSPGIRVELSNDNEFWDDLFFFNDPDIESPVELSNSNNFKNYFRGLYFKIEGIGNSGNMVFIPLSQGSIVVNYTVLVTDVDENGETVETREDRAINMNFTGNTLNILENDPSNTVISNADANADMVNGDETLYLKGGEGSMTVLNLFSGDILDEDNNVVNAFDYFKSKKESWLLNEANLTFYVNQNEVNGQEPDRVILYDLKNNVPIIDYYFDSSTNTNNPLNSKIAYSRKLERDEDNNGVRYKLRLTEHLNNILLRDSTNVNLGLYVSTNVNNIQNADVLNADDEYVTTGTVLSPRGTALYGTNQNVPDDKKVQFEIYFTEPNN